MKKSMPQNTKTLLLCCLVILTAKPSTSLNTITLNKSISDGETVVSAGESYELGFFSPGSSSGKRYLGIWYKKISVFTVVWVANREIPLSDRSGILKLTAQGILVLLNSTRNVIWSSNATRNAENPVAKLLDSGNLVVKDGNGDDPSDYLWESFDFPGDTLLPGMKLGRNVATGFNWFLSSWKSADDPSRGDFTFGIDLHGVPQLILKNGSENQFRAGSWNGLRWTGAEAMVRNKIYTYEFVWDETEVSYKYELLNTSVFSRMVLNASGDSQRLTWIDRTRSWVVYYSVIVDQCDNYGYCGAYASCNINNSPICECLEGFEPRSPRDWSFFLFSDGCVRRIRLDCDQRDGFLKHSGVKLPDTSHAWVNKSMGLEECKELCTKNCSCSAYANADIRGSGCILWFSGLIDIREFSVGAQDLYIRVAASDLEGDARLAILKKCDSDSNDRHMEPEGVLGSVGAKRNARWKVVGAIVGSMAFAVVVLALGLICFVRRKKLQKKGRRSNIGGDNEDVEIFDLDTILNATDHFSNNNKLGQGGFGPVYKGTLTDGQEIAVKRLSKSSTQGLKEFKNEVIMIAKLQHRNLVRLLGCCLEADEIMLIYEFMPNRSLDFFIFDQTRSKFLDWNKQYLIIGGIARGLLYLHQDSRLRIIHRDLKASNILLDNHMNPKISDFGMARMFGGDQTEADTNKIVGTYGYMAPEYAVDGHFSVMSDVFSFGVLVLEIVSGKKNRGFSHQGHSHNLLGHAWKLWNEERALELVDRVVDASYSVSKVLRCIHIGLLCVQQRTEDRPSMTSVVVMLVSEGALPDPTLPGFFTERSVPAESGSSTSMQESLSSVNEITMSVLRAR